VCAAALKKRIVATSTTPSVTDCPSPWSPTAAASGDERDEQRIGDSEAAGLELADNAHQHEQRRGAVARTESGAGRVAALAQAKWQRCRPQTATLQPVPQADR
jgi:hypothetical protein